MKTGFTTCTHQLVTGSDAEGAGEMFRVTNLDAKNPTIK